MNVAVTLYCMRMRLDYDFMIFVYDGKQSLHLTTLVL